MCVSRRHLALLEAQNEEHFRKGLIGYETYVRFADQSRRCWECSLMDNGRQGDMLDECRLRMLRYFVSAKRDDAERGPPGCKGASAG
ncbi:MAG: hypothetical protein ACOCVR_01085 [Myxococcota bacterium]